MQLAIKPFNFPKKSTLQQSLFEFINIPEGHLVNTPLHDSKTV